MTCTTTPRVSPLRIGAACITTPRASMPGASPPRKRFLQRAAEEAHLVAQLPRGVERPMLSAVAPDLDGRSRRRLVGIAQPGVPVQANALADRRTDLLGVVDAPEMRHVRLVRFPLGGHGE